METGRRGVEGEGRGKEGGKTGKERVRDDL